MPKVLPRAAKDSPTNFKTSQRGPKTSQRALKQAPRSPRKSDNRQGLPSGCRASSSFKTGPAQRNQRICNPKCRTVFVTSWPRRIRGAHTTCKQVGQKLLVGNTDWQSRTKPHPQACLRVLLACVLNRSHQFVFAELSRLCSA